MASTVASVIGIRPISRRSMLPSLVVGKGTGRRDQISLRRLSMMSEERLTTSETRIDAAVNLEGNGRFPTVVMKEEEEEEEEVVEEKVKEVTSNPYANFEEAEDEPRKGLKDFFDEAKDFITAEDGGGPPRWFSPKDCGVAANNSPVLLYLPGIDGTGLGLIRHHERLGKIFDVWCLHIPVKDRTSYTDLVKMVEQRVRSENYRSPGRPIYIVADSLGGCIALDVAAYNPDIDLVLILANPATSFNRSILPSLELLLEFMPEQLTLNLEHILRSMIGDPMKVVMNDIKSGLSLQQTFGNLPDNLITVSSYLPVLADILPKETLLWKLQMLKRASASANSHLHAVKAQTLILSSGKDPWLPNIEEGDRLRSITKCGTRKFNDNGHFLFLEDGFDLVTIIKSACLYRRGRFRDYVYDYIPATPFEFKTVLDSNRLIVSATSPVHLSTLADGEVVRGLAGIPSEGPVLYVGYHMLLGLELVPLVSRILIERNVLVRGIAHPMMFSKVRDGFLPELQSFDMYRLMGAVPVSPTNFFKLMSSKSHVLLYPGGMREALHRKGEEYKLFWPEQSEFVRMAARFGAKIVPFGVVGEDDFGEVIFDYDDQMKIPFMKRFIEDLTSEAVKLRTDDKSEVSNQDTHLPGILPKYPGRFYYFFGKPIETEGRKQELKDREKAHELYLQIQTEVEGCLSYLKEKRESDPYRYILPRLIYQAQKGFTSEVPTFEL